MNKAIDLLFLNLYKLACSMDGVEKPLIQLD